MKEKLVVFMIVVLCVVSGYAQADRLFISKDGGFNVILPADFNDFVFSKTSQPTSSGDRDLKKYVGEAARGKCMIIYTDFTENDLAGKTADKVLAESVEGFQQGGSTALNIKNSTVDSYPAKVFDTSIKGNKSLYGRGSIVFAKPRIYYVLFLSDDKGELSKPDVQEYFKSFHIQNLDGKYYESADGRFNAILPSGITNLAFSKTTRSSDFGDYELKLLSDSTTRRTCAIYYYDFPEKAFQTKSTEKMLSDGLEAIRKDPTNTVSNAANLTVDGYPANSFFFSRKQDNSVWYGRTVTVIAKPRTYSLMFLSTDPAELNKLDVLLFFKSFHIQK